MSLDSSWWSLLINWLAENQGICNPATNYFLIVLQLCRRSTFCTLLHLLPQSQLFVRQGAKLMCALSTSRILYSLSGISRLASLISSKGQLQLRCRWLLMPFTYNTRTLTLDYTSDGATYGTKHSPSRMHVLLEMWSTLPVMLWTA
jgi:hypothetical protein